MFYDFVEVFNDLFIRDRRDKTTNGHCKYKNHRNYKIDTTLYQVIPLEKYDIKPDNYKDTNT